MSWFKQSITEKGRINNNIRRYRILREKIFRLKEIAPFSSSNVCKKINSLLNDGLVKANEEMVKNLEFLLSGENNQNIVLDSPKILDNVIRFIDRKIYKETNDLRKLNAPEKEL